MSWIPGNQVVKELGESLLGGDKLKRKVENRVTGRPAITVWRSLLMNYPAAHCIVLISMSTSWIRIQTVKSEWIKGVKTMEKKLANSDHVYVSRARFPRKGLGAGMEVEWTRLNQSLWVYDLRMAPEDKRKNLDGEIQGYHLWIANMQAVSHSPGPKLWWLLPWQGPPALFSVLISIPGMTTACRELEPVL